MTAAERQRRHRAMMLNSDGEVELAAPLERSPERQRLAEEIAAHAAAVERLGRVREAFGQLNVYGLDQEREQAERALADIRERAPRAMVDQLLGTRTHDGGLSVEDAERALAAATRAADDAREARRLLDEEQQAAEKAVGWAAQRRRDAIDDVIRVAPEVANLWASFKAAQQYLEDLEWQLSAARIPRDIYQWDGLLRGNDRGAGAPWKAAISALENDPDAALPDTE